MSIKTIRVRLLAPAIPDIFFNGEITQVSCKIGDVVDLVDGPSLHGERYKSVEYPKGWPSHLFEIVPATTPVTIGVSRPGIALSQIARDQLPA